MKPYDRTELERLQVELATAARALARIRARLARWTADAPDEIDPHAGQLRGALEMARADLDQAIAAAQVLRDMNWQPTIARKTPDPEPRFQIGQHVKLVPVVAERFKMLGEPALGQLYVHAIEKRLVCLRIGAGEDGRTLGFFGEHKLTPA